MEGTRDAEEKSLDLVQRMVISALCVVVIGGPTVALGAYSAFSTAISRSDCTDRSGCAWHLVGCSKYAHVTRACEPHRILATRFEACSVRVSQTRQLRDR